MAYEISLEREKKEKLPFLPTYSFTLRPLVHGTLQHQTSRGSSHAPSSITAPRLRSSLLSSFLSSLPLLLYLAPLRHNTHITYSIAAHPIHHPVPTHNLTTYPPTQALSPTIMVSSPSHAFPTKSLDGYISHLYTSWDAHSS